MHGAAVKPASVVPADDVPPLKESALDDLMLSNSELNAIAGMELASFYTTDEMNDNAHLVSDIDCLGAIYPGEDAVYDGSGWSAVRDELLLEAGGEADSHLVEQTLILFDSPDEAVEFFETSREKWRECEQATDIEVDEGAWLPAQVADVDERTIALKAQVGGTLEGTCQHAMGVVSNLIVEGLSCDADDNDDAQKLTSRILEQAAER
ncbi:sensor domain-containing protein [Mycolicibacterium agri]|uniref:Sensor domain-containing protein n=1 Tax=Mycolicibacterium agri TaxID=36811 RepID=A0A7I9VZ83_MYCAG|nr:sensor domain-containing protein [Mycolicibacterium agri]